MEKNLTNQKWDEVYGKEFGGYWYPAEEVIKFSARYLKRRVGIDAWQKKRDVKRILDAGCGTGRHVLFFQEQGYETHGVDISPEAIEIGNKLLLSKNLKPNLRTGDITKLPFEDEFFDVVVSFGVLDHILFSEAKKSIDEIYRVCEKGAYFYLSLRSTGSSEFGRGEKVSSNTFVLQEGYEKGLIQHYFDLKEISELLQKFKIFSIDLIEEIFPSEYTVDKSFLQSFEGLKHYFDLTKPLNLNLKESRWHIVAEKL